MITTARSSQRQELFDILYSLSEGKGFKTFSKLPMADVGYPFVVIGDGNQTGQSHGKFKINGQLSTRLDVWGEQNNRGSHDLLMFQLEQEMLNLKQLKTVYVKLDGITSNVVKLDEGQERLLHGTIDVTYTYY